MMRLAEHALERNVAPDWLIRIGIRRLLALRLEQEGSLTIDHEMRHKMHMIRKLRQSEIAIEQDKVNEQHYEIPTEFFQIHLGERLKYSSAFYNCPDASLDEAQCAMLQLYCERAELKDGMTVLDLGCGWGSLSLYMADRYPHCQIVGLSNSWTQREFIEQKARDASFSNLRIITGDVTKLDTIDGGNTFDLILSIEMFEHMRNYELLLKKVARWLKKHGRLFTHIFCHTKYIYCMETTGATNWMGRYFFTGGTMACDDVFSYFQDDMRIINRWRVDGRHYAQTAEHWLQNFDRNIVQLRPILRATYGSDATKWEAYWRTFYLSVAELFGYNNGQEWHVSHCLFVKR